MRKQIVKSASMVAIAIVMLGLLRSSIPLVRFVQTRYEILERRGYVVDIYEHNIRETGYARITIATISLLLLVIPFRKGEVWAWGGLLFIFLAYVVPTFCLQTLKHFPGWRPLWEDRDSPLAGGILLDLLFSALMLAALALSFPRFLHNRPR